MVMVSFTRVVADLSVEGGEMISTGHGTVSKNLDGHAGIQRH